MDNKMYNKKAFLFPGQGAQYPGMGKDFYDNFLIARETFEEADDVLNRHLSRIIFEGPEKELTETHNSQTAIYVTSIALLRVLQQIDPELKPQVTAGLSLGEYTALTASGRLSYKDGLNLVQQRGRLMSQACEETHGTMAVVLGMSAEDVEQTVAEVKLPNDLWAANFNCPGQVVISGTLKGIEAGTKALQAKGAKRILPLQVHGAFHSGLMRSAELALAEYVMHTPLKESDIQLVMNVQGDYASNTETIRQNMIKQVTSPVRWEQGIRAMAKKGVDLYVEIGCGKALSGFNKKMSLTAPTLSIEKIADLENIKEYV